MSQDHIINANLETTQDYNNTPWKKPKQQYNVVRVLCSVLNSANAPRIEELSSSGIVSAMVRCLTKSKCPRLQLQLLTACNLNLEGRAQNIDPIDILPLLIGVLRSHSANVRSVATDTIYELLVEADPKLESSRENNQQILSISCDYDTKYRSWLEHTVVRNRLLGRDEDTKAVQRHYIDYIRIVQRRPVAYATINNSVFVCGFPTNSEAEFVVSIQYKLCETILEFRTSYAIKSTNEK
uniref:Armadillo repeat-containing domain-containing protein n=1 Tax=Glossina austeni TaxID=7395 RepID=A0A1A9VGA0_GLOAU